METIHKTTCECREEVVQNAFLIVVFFVTLLLMTMTNFPDLMGDIPAYLKDNGAVATWEWLQGAVCEVEPSGRMICPEDGEESPLTKLLTGFFGMFAFVWLATLQPIKRLKGMIAGARVRCHALKQKWLGTGG